MLFRSGIARNLLRDTAGERVRLDLVELYLPDPGEVQRGERGADMVVPLGTYVRTAGQGGAP